jgi:hypothetical protein
LVAFSGSGLGPGTVRARAEERAFVVSAETLYRRVALVDGGLALQMADDPFAPFVRHLSLDFKGGVGL